MFQIQGKTLHLQKFTPPGDKSGPIKSEPGLTSSSLYSSHYHRYYSTVFWLFFLRNPSLLNSAHRKQVPLMTTLKLH